MNAGTLFLLLLGLVIFLVWGVVAPRSARSCVDSLFNVVLQPLAFIQNGLATGATHLRQFFESTMGDLGGKRGAAIAVTYLVAAAVMLASGYYVTVLTIAGILGSDMVPGGEMTRFEALTGLALIVGIAILLEHLLSLWKVSPLGTASWKDPEDPSEVTKVLLTVVLVGLIAMGCWTTLLLGQARTALAAQTSGGNYSAGAELPGSSSLQDGETSSGSDNLESPAPDTSESASSAERSVMIMLPLFVDIAAAFAVSRAILGMQLIWSTLLWLVGIGLIVVNVIPAIPLLMLNSLRNAIFAFLAFLGRNDSIAQLDNQEELNNAPAQDVPLAPDTTQADYPANHQTVDDEFQGLDIDPGAIDDQDLNPFNLNGGE